MYTNNNKACFQWSAFTVKKNHLQTKGGKSYLSSIIKEQKKILPPTPKEVQQVEEVDEKMYSLTSILSSWIAIFLNKYWTLLIKQGKRFSLLDYDLNTTVHWWSLFLRTWAFLESVLPSSSRTTFWGTSKVSLSSQG